MSQYETIAAIATAAGRAGIGVIRISGQDTLKIATPIIGTIPKARMASYRHFRDVNGDIIDQGLVLYFPKPHSFTGEDVIELQGHGSPAVLKILLHSLLQLGARLAKPGEFSERAFLNDRIDLIQAEAIADLIHAGSEQAARAAIRSLQGEFSQEVIKINQALIQLRTYIEAAIDFSEEEIEILQRVEIEKKLNDLLEALHVLKTKAQQGQLLQEGLRLVIAGPPNAGKSCLLNALSGEEKAIVTDVAGTTRDVLHADLHLEGLPIHIVDTAGLHLTEDIIEKEGIKRALKEIKYADQILWVVDSTQVPKDYEPLKELALFQQENCNTPITLIRNKIDLSGEAVGIEQQTEALTVIRLSAHTQQGMDQLQDYLKEYIGYQSTSLGLSARERHNVSLDHAYNILLFALQEFRKQTAFELLAINLTEAHNHLGAIVGIFTTDDLLGQIFSEFCVGK